MRVFVVLALALAGCPRDPRPPLVTPAPVDAAIETAPAEDARDQIAERIERAKRFPKPSGPAGKRFYLPHRAIAATVFWVGEPSTKQNGCTPNVSSAFDHDWMGAYGGCDRASDRTLEADGFDRPKGFAPKENPYYFALPYGGNLAAPFREEVPWLEDRPDATDVRSAIKNRWIGVRRGDRTCYAQWEDVGPFCVDDVDYVFGYARPRNDGKSCDNAGQGNGTASGLDVSPAVARCLGASFEEGLFDVDWWFVDDAHVPAGPWRRVVTTSPVRDGPGHDAGPCVQAPPYPACAG